MAESALFGVLTLPAKTHDVELFRSAIFATCSSWDRLVPVEDAI